ncbi:MAG: site-specific DNA-methyltransferase [Phycisphaerae bacterium]|nr:site-specific DNA-methyltransferase [Phycisphaerae bacterium]
MENEKIEIKQASGRPMLTWVGKRPLRYVTVFPAQRIESFKPANDAEKRIGDLWNDWPSAYPKGGLLFHGDNKEVLAHLLANGFRSKVNLIYIDPPFNTGVDYIRKVTPRGMKIEKLEGDGYSFTEQIQYSNNWHIDAYLQFLYERLQLAREMLAEDGIIFIRMDVHFGYYLKMIADEIFGQDNFQNEIVVNRIKKNVTVKGRRTIPNAVDYLYVYFRSLQAEFKNVLRQLPETKPGYWHNMDSPAIPGPRRLTLGGKTYYPSPGAHLKFPQTQAEEMWNKGLIRENPKTGMLEYWVQDKDYVNLDSDWTDIPGYTFKTGYPTENAEKLLERVVQVGSKRGDLVMDFFVGSGTTAALAQRLGRRWIGCDINKGAIQTTSKRLQTIILEQIAAQKRSSRKGELLPGNEKPTPAQLSFAAYRVNDYDLQLQHDEAINLACAHVGITRTKADSFFNGTLGNSLAKIISFNHPLTLMDLDEVRRELEARPEETRDVTVVALGKETAVDAWLDDWNHLRKKGNLPNKINVIELRTDPKYGKFFEHKPAEARVKIHRTARKIIVDIQDFISPTVIERLQRQATIPVPAIDDWRAMVDSVMIDASYDGVVFEVAHSDVPEKKDTLVSGHYELDYPGTETVVAVKITDVLGEEVIVAQKA